MPELPGPGTSLCHSMRRNSKGYEMAKLYKSKFTHVSPIWYELKSEGRRVFLDGQHNVDVGWISDLKMNKNLLVVPRIVFEASPTEILQNKHRQREVIDLIIEECKRNGYGGIVLESWSRWAMYGVLQNKEMRKLALQFITNLGIALHSTNSDSAAANHHLQLIFVIAPPSSDTPLAYDFGQQDLQQLAGYVDGYSLMTYDFSGPGNPGPNAPIDWVRASLRVLLGNGEESPRDLAQKIFLGINFYGNDFVLSEGRNGGGAITGGDFVALLDNHQPSSLPWDNWSSEHYFVYSSSDGVKHVVFYPSLLSISVRLDLAQSQGIQVAIWEIGQGLDYFFDLL